MRLKNKWLYHYIHSVIKTAYLAMFSVLSFKYKNEKQQLQSTTDSREQKKLKKYANCETKTDITRLLHMSNKSIKICHYRCFISFKVYIVMPRLFYFNAKYETKQHFSIVLVYCILVINR